MSRIARCGYVSAPHAADWNRKRQRETAVRFSKACMTSRFALTRSFRGSLGHAERGQDLGIDLGFTIEVLQQLGRARIGVVPAELVQRLLPGVGLDRLRERLGPVLH